MAKIEISKVQSGYDVELLLSEHYIKYVLLCLYESGSLPNVIKGQIEISSSGLDYELYPYPPTELDERRLYDINPNFNTNPLNLVQGLTDDESFIVSLIEVIDNGARFTIDLKVAYRFKASTVADFSPAIERVAVKITADIYLQTDTVTGFKTLKIDMIDYHGVGPKADILDALQARNISYDLSSYANSFQKIDVKSYRAGNPADGDGPAALGVYINLNLKDGPAADDTIGDRGDIQNALNFLPAGLSGPENPANHHIGFVLNGSVFHYLGQLIKNGFAKIERDKICEGAFEYPKDLGAGFHNAHIDNVSVSPLYIPVDNMGTIAPANKLFIKLETEEFTYPNIEITLSPNIDDDKNLMTWDIDLHIQDAPVLLAASILLSFIELIALPGGGWFAIYTIFNYFSINKILDAAENSTAEDEVNKTGILDKIPNALGISDKNWDAFMTTSHKVNSSVVQMEIINEGIFLLAKSLWLDRLSTPDESISIDEVVRDDDGNITALQFKTKRMAETIELLNDTESPALTRPDEFNVNQFIPAANVDVPAEDRIIQLTIEEIETRIDKKEILQEIQILPMKLDDTDKDNSVYLVLSKYDYDVFYNQVKTDLTNDVAVMTEIRNNAINELNAQGCNTPQNEAKLNLMINSLLSDRIMTELDDAFPQESGFEITNEEIELLSGKKIISFVNRTDLQAFVLVHKQNGRKYYRDRADGNKKDNLDQLPRFTSKLRNQ